MAENAANSVNVDVSHAVLIVVGAHLRAEAADRPLAYDLCERIRKWVMAHQAEMHDPLEPMVCSDVWYVNQQALQRRPTISIGGPGVNALSAYYANKLDDSSLQDEKMVIQLDPDFVDLRTCIWGMDHQLTAHAVSLFVEHYLDDFLRAAATQVEPDLESEQGEE